MRSKESGTTTLIGLLLATAIGAAALPMIAEMQHRQMLREAAKATGKDLAEFALGLRGFIAAAQSNPSIIPAGTINGANWLKPPACGGLASNPPQGYIPCNFGNYGGRDTLFDASYQTTITRNPTTNYIEARTSFIPITPSDPALRGMIADYIVNEALSENPVPANGLFSNFMSNVPANANDLSARPSIMSNPAHPDYGRVLLIASNAPSQDQWLRTDGTNQMLAALNMGGNDLVNARNIQGAGNMNLGGSAAIGKDASIGQDVQIGRDAVIGQDLVVQRDIGAGRDMTAQRDIISTNGDVRADQGNLTASNGINGDTRGVLIADDGYLTDPRLSNGAQPRLSQAVYDMRVVGANAIVQKPQCPTGLGGPQIFTSIQSIAPNGGEEIHGTRVFVADLGTAWRVTPQVLVAPGGWQNANNAQIVTAVKCN